MSLTIYDIHIDHVRRATQEDIDRLLSAALAYGKIRDRVLKGGDAGSALADIRAIGDALRLELTSQPPGAAIIAARDEALELARLRDAEGK